MRKGIVLLSVLFLCGWVGCASGPKAKKRAKGIGKSQFPSQKDLDKLAKTKPEIKVFDTSLVEVSKWSLQGPFEDKVGDGAGIAPGPWGVTLVKAIKGGSGKALPTRAMACVARETGLFYLKKNGYPANDLKAFIASRCGTVNPSFGVQLVHGEVPDEVADEVLHKDWAESGGKMIGQVLATDQPIEVGIDLVRHEGKAAVVMVWSARRVKIEPISRTPDELGGVEIVGELLVQGNRINAVINQGAYGVATCEVDDSLNLPKFRVRCPTLKEDAQAWIQFAAYKPERVLGEIIVQFAAFPSGTEVNEFQRATYSTDQLATPDSPDTFASQLAGLINGVRKEAGQGPLGLEKAQSEAAQMVTPHYFASRMGIQREGVSDQIVMGLRAGWKVDGAVRRGRFGEAFAAKEVALGDLVAKVMLMPVGREVLLNPNSERVAIGSMVVNEYDAIGVTFTTYSLFKETGKDLEKASQELLNTLARKRVARNNPVAKYSKKVQAQAVKMAQRVQSGGMSRDEALEALMEKSSRILNTGITGWVQDVYELDDIVFPTELLDRQSVSVGIGVAWYQPIGEPWGRYVVLIVAKTPKKAI